MAYTLPSLNRRQFVVGSSGACGAWLASRWGRGQEAVADGNLLVASAARTMAASSGWEAKLRQRVSVLGQLGSGTGFIMQSPAADGVRVRLEFKLQVGNASLALLQVNDGDTLWIRRDSARGQQQAYVNLRRIREQFAQRDRRPAPDQGMNPGLWAWGGIGPVLQELARRFQFGPAAATEIAGLPMWEVTGTWRGDELARILPGQREAAARGEPVRYEDLPRHLPTSVRLALGRDQRLPLFPYRLEFSQSREVPTSEFGGGSSLERPLATIELYEARPRQDFPADLFKFGLRDENVEDQTEDYLRRLTPLVSPQATGDDSPAADPPR